MHPYMGQPSIMLDILFKNCKVVDGTGNPWYRADVAVKDGKISGIGKFNDAEAKEVIDAKGMVLSPGFIDMHSHSDLAILVEPEAKQKIMQGVTTELLGQDGTAIAPVKPKDRPALRKLVSGLLGDPDVTWDWTTYDDYLTKLENLKTSTNLCTLVPYGQIRQWAMGSEDREPTGAELEEMKEVCRQAFRDGVVGMSIGLVYPPCVFAKAEEIIEICKVAAECGGFLVSHIRNESDRLLEAVDEILNIAKASGIPLHISHLKTSGKSNWHKVDALLAKLETGREADGVELTFDQYPYTAASTMLFALLPPWAHAGGVDALLARLKDKEARAKMKADVLSDDTSTWENWVKNCGWEGIVVTAVKSQKHKKYEGKNMVEIAKDMGVEPIEATFELLLENDTTVSMVMFWGCEEGVAKILKHPYYTAGSDGLLGGKPHPRVYGTFARVLGKYSREEKLIRLEDAVRHMSALPAQRIGLTDRGVIKEGMVADLVLFDPATIIDTATYVEPHQYPLGVHFVVVNGQIVVRNGQHTGARPGKVLRKGR